MDDISVLSFDPKRVKFVTRSNGTMVVEKRTSVLEYRQIIDATKQLAKYPIILRNGTISVTPVTVVTWNEQKSILVTEYCEGLNLEWALKTADKRKRIQWIELFNEFFQMLRLNGFLWGDCAPRNMIFNENLDYIKICDFERPLVLKDCPVDPCVFSRYIRNYSWEEFSCFLFEEEQEMLFSSLLTEESDKSIPISDINSTRKKKLLKSVFGPQKNYHIKEVQKAERLMVSIATPCVANGVRFYPMELIDRIVEEKGANTYVKIVQELKNLNSEEKARRLREKWRSLSSDFSLLSDTPDSRFIVSASLNLKIKVKPGGYVPRSGLLLAEYLNSIDIKGDVYDIGTGETGLLAYYAKARGAKKVIACDKDCEAICHTEKASPAANEIMWLVGNVFAPITSSCKFDFILSNPPQMPMSQQGSLHDYGGYDGRKIILRIIKGASNYLSCKGFLFLLCFDFLGVTERYNTKPSIQEVARENGLDCKVCAGYQRLIRKGGKTEENLPWINKIYPKYKFKKSSNGNLYHRILILELKHF